MLVSVIWLMSWLVPLLFSEPRPVAPRVRVPSQASARPPATEGVAVVLVFQVYVSEPMRVSVRLATWPTERTPLSPTFQSAFTLRVLRVRSRGPSSSARELSKGFA